MNTLTPIVIARAGSHLYGLQRPDSDLDSMGLGVMSREQKLGLNQVEQQGKDDHVIYEITKWLRLALNGNPTVLQLLWTPPEMWLQWDSRWPRWQKELQALVPTERCRSAFLGYLDGQRKKLINDRGQRQEIKAQHGYDTKFAMHMLRLGIQGIEVIETGQLHLPMREADINLLRKVRAGCYAQAQVLDWAAEFEYELKICPSVLPSSYDPVKVNQWLMNFYQEVWG